MSSKSGNTYSYYFLSHILPVAFRAVILLSLSKWRLRFVWFSKRRFLSKNSGVFRSKTEKLCLLYSNDSFLTFTGLLVQQLANDLLRSPKRNTPVEIAIIMIFNNFPHPVLQSGPFMWRSGAYSPVVETERYFIVSRIILSLSFQW